MILCPGVRKIVLRQHERARTKDPKLLAFLEKVRTTQPTREELYDFFGNRYLGRNLPAAIDKCARCTPEGMPSPIWLTCTNKGSDQINYGYLEKLGYGTLILLGCCLFCHISLSFFKGIACCIKELIN